jgi:subtilase family serine protease
MRMRALSVFFTIALVCITLSSTIPPGITQGKNSDEDPKYDNLTIGHPSYSPSSVVKNKVVTIELVVRNEGEVYHDNITVAFYDNYDIVGISPQIVLGPYVNGTVVFMWTPNSSGTHRLKFIVDPDNVITEINEDDNIIVDKVTVRSGETAPNGVCGDWMIIMTLGAASAPLAAPMKGRWGGRKKSF